MNEVELFERSKKLVPGGVHSPVRSFKGLHRGPIFFDKASGASIFDVNQKEYIDFCMSFGPLILGHKNEIVAEELTKAISRGWSFGAAEKYSLELAEFIVGKIPFIEQIRFVNSGTEAVMTALRIARGVTNRDRIIKFSGCYHGHTDSMLIKAGSGLAGTSEASSKGIPQSVIKDTIVLDLDDIEGVKNTFLNEGENIAAVIIEPLPANNGLLIQNEKFLNELRLITKKHGALLIFDEVISGFRIGIGGMSERLNIIPDLVTYGKIIGGGLPVGAIAGKREIMEVLAPVGSVYQAGTLSANPLAMVGGLSTLKQMDEKKYLQINENTKKIVELFKTWIRKNSNDQIRKLNIVSYDSLFWFVNNEGKPIHSINSVPSDLAQSFLPLFKTLVEKGIYLAPNAYEVGFTSYAHNDLVISKLEEILWK